MPYPLGTAGILTPYFAPTAEVSWNAEAINVYWNGYGKVDKPEWISNTLARLAVYPEGLSDAYVTVDITEGKNARAVVSSIHSDWMIYSPQGTFVIECSGGMRMYRTKDHSLVSETSLMPPVTVGVNCSTFINWATNESAVSFQAGDQSVYIWRSDGSVPEKTAISADTADSAWSPDSSKLAINSYRIGSRTYILDILDAAGQVLHEFPMDAGSESNLHNWLTNEVLTISYGRYTDRFYSSNTGELLFSWTSTPTGNGVFHQYPTASPNGRWVFFDQGDQMFESTLDPNHSIVQKQYSLYDVQAKRQYTLLDRLGEYLAFADWSADDSTLYLVGRPAESVSTSDPSAPFGLLAYNLKTHQYQSLFKDAVQVGWNADKTWAFVVFADRDEASQLGLAGGLWKVGSDTLVGKWRLSDQMVYRDPAFDTFLYPGPIPIAWSHTRESVAVSDQYGRVEILNLDGTQSILTTQMPDEKLAMRWSPDDRHLLVEQGNQAWIVDIPTP